jgi:hypothetical protein
MLTLGNSALCIYLFVINESFAPPYVILNTTLTGLTPEALFGVWLSGNTGSKLTDALQLKILVYS